jgi:hypothetical protein
MAQCAACAKLIASLLLVVKGYTGYAVPAEQPGVELLPASQLQARFCGQPCPIHAFFPPGRTIYLESGFDVFHDALSESILVHELTHWLQQENLGHPARTCREWMDREYQAYNVQYRWLRETAGTIREFSLRMAKLGHPVLPHCSSDPAQAGPAISDAPASQAHSVGPVYHK